jgi:uncharacterized RDD family membrane protein YckC
MIPTPPPFRHYPVTPAGFWIRLAAFLVDLATVMVTVNLVQLGLRSLQTPAWIWTAMNLVLTVIYFGFFYSRKGATPGKWTFGIRVRHQGHHPGFFRSILRETLGKTVSVALFFGGFVMSAFRKDKLALHDLVFGTRVVKCAPLQPAWVAAAVTVFILNAGLTGALVQKIQTENRSPASVPKPEPGP